MIRLIPFLLLCVLFSNLSHARDLVISENEIETYTANPNCAKVKPSGKLTSQDKDLPLVHVLSGRFRCADEQESYLVIERNGAKHVLKAKDSVVIPEAPKELKKILFEAGIPTQSFSSTCENIKERGKFQPRDVKGTQEISDAQLFRCESEKVDRRAFYIFNYSGVYYSVSSEDVVLIAD